VRSSWAATGRLVALATLPMMLATAGAGVDEWRALGFTTWRSACRATGISLPSIATFTLELLPTAVVGALLGGLLVLVVGLRHPATFARGALAAHASCVLVMPLGLLLCASAWPWALTLAAETTLAAFVAVGAWWFTRIRRATYARHGARGVSRIPPRSAAAENFSINPLWKSHDCH